MCDLKRDFRQPTIRHRPVTFQKQKRPFDFLRYSRSNVEISHHHAFRLSHHTLNAMRSYFVVAALCSAAVAAASLNGGSAVDVASAATSRDQGPSGSGSLAVAGQLYSFEADHCVITESDFLATGSGEVDDQHFQITASISSVELTFGAGDDQDPDRHSLRSYEPPSWSKSQDGLEANVALTDPLDPDSPALASRLKVSCIDLNVS